MTEAIELNLAARIKGHHRVRFEQSWIELSSSLRKRTAQRRSAITESERSDSEWIYRSSSGSELTADRQPWRNIHDTQQQQQSSVNDNSQSLCNGEPPAAAADRPAHASSGIVDALKGGVESDKHNKGGFLDKRVFVAPKKTPVPVEWRRQRAQQPGDNRVPIDVPLIPTVAAAINSLPLDLTDRPTAFDSPVEAAHSVTVSDRVKTFEHQEQQQQQHWLPRRIKLIDDQCGFFRQILSEDEVIYDMPHTTTKANDNSDNNNKPPSPEPLPVEEALYAEPSVHSVCSTLNSFGERRSRFNSIPSSCDDDGADSSHYADPCERYASFLDHNYEEMDHDTEEYHPSRPIPQSFTRRVQSKEQQQHHIESGVSISNLSDSSSSSGVGGGNGGYFSSDSGAGLSIPPGLARSRAELFESIAKANQHITSRPHHHHHHHHHHGHRKLVEALGPQLALHSLSSLPHPPDSSRSVLSTSRSCPPSLNAVNWTMGACVDNDLFFMEFANQRIALPVSDSPATSCSSIQSSGSSENSSSDDVASSVETESTNKSSKSCRKVSFVLGPASSSSSANRILGQHYFTQSSESKSLLIRNKPANNKEKPGHTANPGSAAVNFARFFKQTLTVIGRCGGGGGGRGHHLSDSESLLSQPLDDLLSQSDLEMFCKPESEKRERKDSGTDVTTPDASLSGGSTIADDIDAALAILEVKARARTEAGDTKKVSSTRASSIPNVCSGSCTSSSDGSDLDSASCSSGNFCQSSCDLTDCSSWTEGSWTSDGFTSSDDDSSRLGATSPALHHDTSLEVTSSDTSRLEDPGSPTQPNDGKHSLLQFALYHFRQSPEKFEMLRHDDPNGVRANDSNNVSKSEKKKSKGKKSKDRPDSSAGSDWTWKEQVDLVKFTKSPIQASLLQLDSNELNKLALECFLSIMKYMGDYPMAKGQSEVDCVYTILMNCHKHESLRDETYCQIMKQTTNNKSSRPDSCQRGWRLFSITAAYFSCSEVLKPYLFKYLETAAYDKRRAYHGTAMVCLQNLRKTLRYGGRKNVPSIEEITAITAGRNSKRQMYRLPGGTERVINTKSTSVVQDIIEEICGVINVRSDQEMEEYSLYCIVEGDTFTMPLAREEYILDVTTELQKNQQVYYLIFCRSVWHYPMRLENALYIEIVFNQIAPDYLEGLLLVMPGEQISQDCVYDIAKVAALLHRAADLDHMPTMKETKYLLPKPALTVRDIKPPQWVNLVQSSWKDVEHFKPSQAKAQVLEILEKWSLFGSSFFAVRRDADATERSEHILALNRNGVHFLDVITHETLMHYPYSEVISTRKVKSEEGPLFLDMKCGNLMQQRVTRIQTDQAHEISRLIRQYITIQQRIQQQSAKEESNLASR